MTVIFEPHATTFDNEAKVASGWNDVALSKKGEQQAEELGRRYKLQELDAVFCADLQRAFNTAKIAFPNITTEKLFMDWRLRECNYGDLTLATRQKLDEDKGSRIIDPFPNGESYQQAMERMKSFIDYLRSQPFEKVLIIGSRATHYGLDYHIDNVPLEKLLATKFAWQPGWQYEL